MRVRESHEPDWHYEVEVSPLGREEAAMVFSVGMDDPDRVDTLRLACDEARRITRPYVADWKPFCDSGIEDCDAWAMGAFEETQNLNERRLASQELEAALGQEGWFHSRLNLFDLSIHHGGSSHRMAVGVDWDIWADEPQFFTRISDGWFRSDSERCAVSVCDARTYARNLNLDSPVYPELGPFWPPTSYGVSYP